MWVLALFDLWPKEGFPGTLWYREKGASTPAKVLLDFHLAWAGRGREGEPCSLAFRVSPAVARLEGGPPPQTWFLLLYRSPRASERWHGPPTRYLEQMDLQGGR